MKRIFIPLLLTLLLSYSVSHAQSVDSSILRMAEMVKNLNRFGHYNAQEKVYLHFDNTGYYLGETMWFKAYVVSATLGLPTDMSKVLYVELLTPEGRVAETKKLKIVDGQCHGEFLLSGLNLSAGFYEVRAYTRIMLNWGTETVFSRVFPVFDQPETEGAYKLAMTRPAKSKELPQMREKAEKRKRLNLSFYPEGGDMVAGLPTVVAFKATDDEGRGVDVTGSVIDKEGDAVAEFTTQHNGMGRFLLVPGETEYKAVVRYNDKKYDFKLPTVKAQGYAMTVNNLRGDKMHIQVHRTDGAPAVVAGLTVSCRGRAYAFELADLHTQQAAHIQIDKQKFPAGVLQVTLFTDRGEILAERLAFHNNGKYLHITSPSLRESYKPYERVGLDFMVSDELGNPAVTTFSLAVRDCDTELPTHYRGDIMSNLLLESDLRGYIEDIPYYFEADDRIRRNALDLLMLVQGWRRYSWQQMTGVTPFNPEHLLEEGILVKGQVVDYTIRGEKPRPNVDLSVWIYSPTANSKGHTRTDDRGQFVFLSDSDIWGDCDMILRSQKTKKSGDMANAAYTIKLDRVFSPTPLAYHPISTTLPDSMQGTILRRQEVAISADSLQKLSMSEREHNLQEVEVTARRKVYNETPSITYNVAAEEDKLIDSGELDYTDNIPDMLERINPYFSYIPDTSGNNVYRYKNRPAEFTFSWDSPFYMGEILDAAEMAGIAESNMPADTVGFKTDVLSLSTKDVKSIEIVESWNKVFIRVTCYPTNEQRREHKGYRVTTLQGYSVPQDYYRIDYSRGALPAEGDFRRTVYWNPSVTTDSNGKASVQFYNNGSHSRLRISAETLSPTGTPGLYRE